MIIVLTDSDDADTATLTSDDAGTGEAGATDVTWTAAGAKDGTYTITATVTVSDGTLGGGDTITVTPTTGISLGEHVTALDAGCFEASTSAANPDYTLTVTGVTVSYAAAE